MKKHKLFAPFLMLFVGAITYFCLLGFKYEFRTSMIILLVVMVVFYIIGLIIQNKVNKFVEENEKKAQEEAEKEGAVIEKEAPPEEEAEGEEESSGLPPLTGAGAFREPEDTGNEDISPDEDTESTDDGTQTEG